MFVTDVIDLYLINFVIDVTVLVLIKIKAYLLKCNLKTSIILYQYFDLVFSNVLLSLSEQYMFSIVQIVIYKAPVYLFILINTYNKL